MTRPITISDDDGSIRMRVNCGAVLSAEEKVVLDSLKMTHFHTIAVETVMLAHEAGNFGKMTRPMFEWEGLVFRITFPRTSVDLPSINDAVTAGRTVFSRIREEVQHVKTRLDAEDTARNRLEGLRNPTVGPTG